MRSPKRIIPEIRLQDSIEFSIWSSMTAFGPGQREFTYISSEGATFPIFVEGRADENLTCFKNSLIERGIEENLQGDPSAIWAVEKGPTAIELNSDETVAESSQMSGRETELARNWAEPTETPRLGNDETRNLFEQFNLINNENSENNFLKQQINKRNDQKAEFRLGMESCPRAKPDFKQEKGPKETDKKGARNVYFMINTKSDISRTNKCSNPDQSGFHCSDEYRSKLISPTRFNTDETRKCHREAIVFLPMCSCTARIDPVIDELPEETHNVDYERNIIPILRALNLSIIPRMHLTSTPTQTELKCDQPMKVDAETQFDLNANERKSFDSVPESIESSETGTSVLTESVKLALMAKYEGRTKRKGKLRGKVDFSPQPILQPESVTKYSIPPIKFGIQAMRNDKLDMDAPRSSQNDGLATDLSPEQTPDPMERRSRFLKAREHFATLEKEQVLRPALIKKNDVKINLDEETGRSEEEAVRDTLSTKVPGYEDEYPYLPTTPPYMSRPRSGAGSKMNIYCVANNSNFDERSVSV